VATRDIYIYICGTLSQFCHKRESFKLDGTHRMVMSGDRNAGQN
jgi:hypothetical protein